MRQALELHAAERTVGRLGPPELRELRGLMEATLCTIDGSRFADRPAYLAANAALHDRQVALARNALLLGTYRTLAVNVLMERVLGDGNDCGDVANEHIELVAAFERASLEDVHDAIRAHVATGKRLALDAIERSGGAL